MRLLPFAFAIIVAGCGSIEPLSERGNYLTFGHGSRESGFKEAYDEAAARCEKKGLVAAPTSSICPDRCITNFECRPAAK